MLFITLFISLNIHILHTLDICYIPCCWVGMMLDERNFVPELKYTHNIDLWVIVSTCILRVGLARDPAPRLD